jgi:maltooligosyltrehalose synthase
LIGIWPPDLDIDAGTRLKPLPPLGDLVDRLKAYMIKSVKEAKVHTSWLTPNEEYENAVARFVDGVMIGPAAVRFLPAFAGFAQRIAQIGTVNGLAQVALKIGSPGVPDFYQGTELWDFSLVDPDNRRPVDFDRRRHLLDDIDRVMALPASDRAAAVAAMMDRWPDGEVKLLLTTVGLRLRRENPDLFLSGRYMPLAADVPVHASIVAFARILDDRAVLFVAPRLVAPVASTDHPLPLGGDVWKTSRVLLPPELAGRTFRHAVTGAELTPTTIDDGTWLFAGQIFETVPVGILVAS